MKTPFSMTIVANFVFRFKTFLERHYDSNILNNFDIIFDVIDETQFTTI